MNDSPETQGHDDAPASIGSSGANRTRSTWKNIKEFPVYTAIVACLPLLNSYAQNRGLIPDATLLIRPILVSILVATVLTFIASRLMRSTHRGAFAVAMFLVFLAVGDRIAEQLSSLALQITGLTVSPEYPLLVVFLALIALIAFVAVTRISAIVTVAANVWILAVLISMQLMWEIVPLGRILGGNEQTAATLPDVFAGAEATGDKPDIYHVTLDGYARADIIRDLHGFDNSSFLDQLQNLGFSVPDQATTPYNQTRLVMLSIFEGSYLDWLTQEPALEPDDYRDLIRERYLENSTIRSLAQMGYNIQATHTEYPPVDIGRHEMLAPRSWLEMNFFERLVFEQNVLSLIERKLAFLGDGENYTASLIREAYRAPFEHELGSPLFLYTHLIAPHPPFDIAWDGKRRNTLRLHHRLLDASEFHEGIESRQSEYTSGYIEKLRFINNETAAYLKRVIEELPDPKIIVVHGDHGSGLFVDSYDIQTTCLKERMSPFLAVYSSDGQLQKQLTDDFNLVNIYRMIFSTYFNKNLPALESRNFYVPYGSLSTHIPVGKEDLEASCSTSG